MISRIIVMLWFQESLSLIMVWLLYGISTLVGYLMHDPVYTYILFLSE